MGQNSLTVVALSVPYSIILLLPPTSPFAMHHLSPPSLTFHSATLPLALRACLPPEIVTAVSL